MEIISQCIAEAHERVVDAIIDEGVLTSIEVEPGKVMNTWELADPVMIIVRHPDEGQLVSEACEFGDGFIAQYKKDMCTVQKRGFVYEYPARLFDYPWITYEMNELDSTPYTEIHGNGNGDGFDQIAKIIEKLTGNPTNRRALAITWVPELDANAIEPPCLQFTHFLIRKGIVAYGQNPFAWYLSGRFPFRSHDMLSGYPANAIGLLGLMEYVAAGVSKNTGYDVRIGSLITWSSSAHIYCDAQSKLLSVFTGLIARKKMGKIWWVSV
jgi:thymidylate synthase (methanogen type)